MQQQSSKGLPRDLCGPVALLLMLALSPATALASQIIGEISLDSNPGTFFKTLTDPLSRRLLGSIERKPQWLSDRFTRFRLC